MKNANISYLSLTPETQLDALASINIYPESGLTALNSYENRVYLFTDENKIRYIVKFYRPQRWSKKQILEEHQFSHELDQQGCNLAAPIKINGQSLFSFQGYYFALFKSLSARTIEPDNIDQLYDIGVALGKMHKTSAQGIFQYREPLDVQQMVSKPIESLKSSILVPKFIRQPLFKKMDILEKKVTDQFKQNNKLIRLHGDCHTSNILANNNIPYFVDFDDCKMGPAVQDLWMLISGDKQEKQLQLSMLLDGYQEEYEFDQQELALIEPLRTMRIINYVYWINKRWADPAFPKNFPWFISDDYWKELLQALQQQIVALEEVPLTLQPCY